MLAPICLFTYKRLSETKQTVEALQKNEFAVESDIFIFSDGPKHEKDILLVNDVRKYIKFIRGFRSITIIESERNKGLAKSIIDGVTQIVEKYDKVIVLEDDLITSQNFLSFTNQALDFYEKNSNIFSISGYTLNLPSLSKYHKDFYLGVRASSWGWATWKDRWNTVNWEVSDYDKFKWNIFKQFQFMKGGSDLPLMLRRQMNGKIDSWAIRWCYQQFVNKQFTIFPSISKVQCIGFGSTATHTKNYRRFETELDNTCKSIFNFEFDIILEIKLLNEFRNKFSILNRIRNRLNF